MNVRRKNTLKKNNFAVIRRENMLVGCLVLTLIGVALGYAWAFQALTS